MTRTRRSLLRIALGGLAAVGVVLLLTATVLLALLPVRDPLVAQTDGLVPRDVVRALQLARWHDPRRAIPGVVRVLALSQHEAEVLLNLAASRLHPGRWALTLAVEELVLRGSLPLPANPLGAWLNVELKLRQRAGLPELEALRVGRLRLPATLAQWLVDLALARQGLDGWQAAGAATIRQVRFRRGRIDIVYAWDADAPARLLAALLPAREQARLQLYAARLATLAATHPAGQPLPLSAVLPPLFELARSRSSAGEDPAAENRAVLMVLGMAANGISLAPLLPSGDDGRASASTAPRIRLTLAGRGDFPQHYLSSATLAAETGSPLADLIGLYKELADARSGSGFSFNDVAANRAGTRLGAMAVAAPLLLQERAAASRSDLDLLPDISDLPEFMSERELHHRFGEPGSPGYERMMEDIESRLGATPILQPAH